MDLKTLTMDKLIGNLKTYEMKKQQEQVKKETKKEKNLALEAAKGEIIKEGKDIAYITKWFLKVIIRNWGFQRRGNSSRSPTGNDLSHKYEKPSHFIKDCLMHKAKHKE